MSDETRTIQDKPYNQSLPSYPPFMWVENEHEFFFSKCPNLKLLAYGAYNAMGLIGSEYGGIALVVDGKKKFVVAKKFVPHSILARSIAFAAAVHLLQGLDDPCPQDVVAFAKEHKWDQINT